MCFVQGKEEANEGVAASPPFPPSLDPFPSRQTPLLLGKRGPQKNLVVKDFGLERK